MKNNRREPPWLTFSDLLGNSFFILLLTLALTLGFVARNRKPPIIQMSEAEKFRFPSGAYTPDKNFQERYVKTILPKIKDILTEYPQVDTLEIIGHTDGQPNGDYTSNLDLQKYLFSDNKTLKISEKFKAGSNVDLGMLRALSVMSLTKNVINSNCKQNKESYCRPIIYRIYSAGSFIDSNNRINYVFDEQNASRRRIEIRFTQTEKKRRKND
jgi:flagellar motor protein MotB